MQVFAIPLDPSTLYNMNYSMSQKNKMYLVSVGMLAVISVIKGNAF